MNKLMRALRKMDNEHRRNIISSQLQAAINEQDASRRKYKRDTVRLREQHDRKEQAYAERIAALMVANNNASIQAIHLDLLDRPL